MLGSDQADAITLAPVDTHLPFTLGFAFADWPGSPQSRSRRRGLVIGLSLTMALALLAAYGLFRATTREMALARQQSDFIAAVSHEFRTPLTSMRHLTDLLVSNGILEEARTRKYHQLLARETERLHHMVEGLLSFSRIRAGAYVWRLEPADATDVVRAVVDDFRLSPRVGDRDIVYEADTDLPLIRTDREALAHAISNLLENAEKYSGPGTPIRVLARRGGDSVRISVEDRGVGIPPGEQRHLFDRFVRGAHAKREGIRGLGVGLALVKSVAEAHGGSVVVDSAPGRGSVFTLVIPCLAS
jgi:two-component system phosphate regulon sensor histidine kinase PhoR